VPNLNVFRSDVAEFFQPSIDCIVKAVHEQKKIAHKTISVSFHTTFFKYRFPYNFLLYFQHVVLVGGFAASDWLFNKVYQSLTPLGLNIVRPENRV
jgi:hypothetical protein